MTRLNFASIEHFMRCGTGHELQVEPIRQRGDNAQLNSSMRSPTQNSTESFSSLDFVLDGVTTAVGRSAGKAKIAAACVETVGTPGVPILQMGDAGARDGTFLRHHVGRKRLLSLQMSDKMSDIRGGEERGEERGDCRMRLTESKAAHIDALQRSRFCSS